MKIIKKRPLSEVQADITKEQLEQNITDLEIALIEQGQVMQEQEQAITDHDIAILELQQAINQ